MLIFHPAAYSADSKTDSHRIEDKDITVVIGSRTPDQLAAFYSGRGFNQASIDAIKKTCFVFGMVDNKTYDTLWLSLDEWEFHRCRWHPVKTVQTR